MKLFKRFRIKPIEFYLKIVSQKGSDIKSVKIKENERTTKGNKVRKTKNSY